MGEDELPAFAVDVEGDGVGVLGALSVEGEGRCEVDSSWTGERGCPNSSSEFEGQVREERAGGFFDGLRG